MGGPARSRLATPGVDAACCSTAGCAGPVPGVPLRGRQVAHHLDVGFTDTSAEAQLSLHALGVPLRRGVDE